MSGRKTEPNLIGDHVYGPCLGCGQRFDATDTMICSDCVSDPEMVRLVAARLETMRYWFHRLIATDVH